MGSNDEVVSLPAFCAPEDFELFAKKTLGVLRKGKNLRIDFQHLRWIPTLQISLLYEIACIAQSSNTEITFDLRQCEHKNAVDLLRRTGFFDSIRSIGIRIEGGKTAGTEEGLAAFRCFNNSDELRSYEHALASQDKLPILLGGGVDVDIIREGDFRDIVLRELGDNAFIHGGGLNVRYAIIGNSIPSPKNSRSILSDLQGRPYIEIVVSDSGSGIFKTLALPKQEYAPYQQMDVPSRLGDEARLVAYAFEFGSTSNPSDRKERLRSIYHKEHIDVDAVPTGLFYVGSLCKSYGGQLLIRSGVQFFSIDYSESNQGKITSAMLPKGQSLASFTGTHILLRVPHQKYKIQPRQGMLIPASRQAESRLVCFSLETIRRSALNEADFILAAEQCLEECVLQAEKSDSPTVVVIADGLEIDTKALAILWISYSLIERRGRKLIVAGLSAEMVSAAAEQWYRIRKRGDSSEHALDRIHGYRAFVLASTDFTKLAEFGRTNYSDSTSLASHGAESTATGLTEDQVATLYRKATTLELQDILKHPSVLHSGKEDDIYYLIERKYYTQDFFEVSKLLRFADDGLEKLLLGRALLDVLSDQSIDDVYIISEPLLPLITMMRGLTPKVEWHSRESSLVALLALRGSKARRILLLMDVICSGNTLQDLLRPVSSKLEQLSVLCFVDARPADEFEYIVYRRRDAPFHLKVSSLLRYPITQVKELPRNVPISNVRIVDPKTHAPTSYEALKPLAIETEKLIDRAASHGALAYGHISHDSKHYAAFLNLGILFQEMSAEIYEWWDGCQHRMLAHRRSAQINEDASCSKISLYYLDEKRGWEGIVVDYSATKQIQRVRTVTREQLDAPPDEKNTEKEDVIWFVLPVISSGTTLESALAYAATLRPRLVFISILLARMDPRRFSFYKNLNNYADFDVIIDTLSLFPIEYYLADGSCPLCKMALRIEELRKHTSGYRYLHGIAARYQQSVQPYEMASERPTTEADREKAKLRAALTLGERAVDMRKELNATLSDHRGRDYFLEMVGDDSFSPLFSLDVEYGIWRTVYKKIEKSLSSHADELLNNAPSMGLPMNRLLGIHHLFPKILKNKFVHLLGDAIQQNQPLTDNLVLLALLFPEVYAIQVAVAVKGDYSELWQQRLIRELRLYPYWSSDERSRAVQYLYALHWLVLRTSGWGAGLGNLWAVIQSNDGDLRSIKKKFQAFDDDGITPLNRYIELLRFHNDDDPHAGLWSAIQLESEGFDDTVNQLFAAEDDLRGAIGRGLSARSDIITLVSRLQNLGKELSGKLESIFTNPTSVKYAVEDNLETWYPKFPARLTLDVAPDQPGILIGYTDLIKCIRHVLDNVDECIDIGDPPSKNNYWINFQFAGLTKDKLASELLVRDNLPWPRPLHEGGGMKDFGKVCEKYAALYDFNSATTEEPNLHIRVIFHVNEARRMQE